MRSLFPSLSHGGIGAREQLGRQSRRTRRKMVPVFITILVELGIRCGDPGLECSARHLGPGSGRGREKLTAGRPPDHGTRQARQPRRKGSVDAARAYEVSQDTLVRERRMSEEQSIHVAWAMRRRRAMPGYSMAGSRRSFGVSCSGENQPGTMYKQYAVVSYGWMDARLPGSCTILSGPDDWVEGFRLWAAAPSVAWQPARDTFPHLLGGRHGIVIAMVHCSLLTRMLQLLPVYRGVLGAESLLCRPSASPGRTWTDATRK